MARTSTGTRSKVRKVMHERKHGTLRSGSGRKVTSRKQAIAIGLSEAREAGEKVPPRKSGARKSATRKSSSRKTTGRKSASRKSASRKATRRKSATRKSASRRTSSRKRK